MEVKIGIQSVPRELVVETDMAAGDLERTLAKALEEGGLFAIPTNKDGRLLIPADKIAYLEFGGSESRRVGF